MYCGKSYLPFSRLIKGDFFPRIFFFYCTLFDTALSAAPQNSTVSKDAGIEPRTIATLALTARRSRQSARSLLHYPYLQTKSSLHQPCGHILYITRVYVILPISYLHQLSPLVVSKYIVVGPWILLCIFFFPISRVEMGCPVTACPKVHRSYSCCNFLQKYTMLIFRNYFSNDGLRKYARGSAVQLSYSAAIIDLFLGLGFS